jgi:imidazole glycerol-phosphate synthase subunit HisF
MKKLRVIARLDVKNEFVIKGIHLEGLRKIGDPNEMARRYYEQGADEILMMDAVASLYERNGLFGIIQRACQEVFVPITVGGGIRTMLDIELALKAGADKVGINTQAIKTPSFIQEASRTYGSQCIVASIEAKQKGATWEAYVNNGRESTGVNVLEWISRLEELGAGEILLTSVDQEGTRKGFDLDLAKQASARVTVPIIISGGAGKIEHILELVNHAKADAVALASCLHYRQHTLEEIKHRLISDQVPVRV